MNPLSPKEVWGNFLISSWSETENITLSMWLSQIAAAIPYAEQVVCNRIIKHITEVLLKANSKELSYKESIDKILPLNLFSKKELDDIQKNVQILGPLSFNKIKN